MKVNVCPSTLAPGHISYSSEALKVLFDNRIVSHNLDMEGPYIQNAGAAGKVSRISLSGVQTKMSLVLTEDNKLRYPEPKQQGTFILKPKPLSYHLMAQEDCPANENLTMQIATQAYRIETAPNALVFFKGDEAAYITRRFDVHPGGKYQQEDFASILGYTKANGGSDYKYCNSSYEECADVIRQNVKAWRVDMLRFFKLIVFNYLSLNDDAHLKNFSLILRGGEYRLSAAYDLINTSLHLYQPKIFALDKGLFREGMSMSDVRMIERRDFEEFGKRIGLARAVISRELDRFSQEQPLVRQLVDNSFLTEQNKKDYWRSFDYRRKTLTF